MLIRLLLNACKKIRRKSRLPAVTDIEQIDAVTCAVLQSKF